MKFLDFTEKYWDVFNRHVCKYHALETAFIRTYSYDLDWYSLSKNVNIDWSEDLLDDFQDNWVWDELAANASIVWTPKLINKYKTRLDWHNLLRNRHLPISDSFLSEFTNIKYVIESNIYLNDELVEKYNLNLISNIQNQGDDYCEDLDIEEFIDRMNNNSSFSFYNKFLFRELDNESINLIYREALDYENRFFEISPLKNDKYGLTPEFIPVGGNIFGNYGENKLLDMNEEIEYANGSLVEGPSRLYECLRFALTSFYPVILISENVKKILECFIATKHQYVPIVLNDKKLVSNLKYYVLQMERDSLLQTLDFKNLQFKIKTKQKYFTEVYSEELLEIGSVRSYAELLELQKQKKTDGIEDRAISPTEYYSNNTYDIFTIDYAIVVSQRVKDAIEKYLPNQVLFKSMQRMHIKQTKQVEADNRESLGITLKKHNITKKKDYQFYQEKVARLSTQINIDGLPSLKDDEFSVIQKKLLVVIPDKFKSFYRKNKNIDDFQFLKISEFYIENGYSDVYPESYKSLIVAANGLGDFLGLLLKKKDDYKLDNKIYLFSHEDSMIEIFE